MGVYTRFKKTPGGLRAIVELIESTPSERRKRMLDVGQAEDAEYTQRILTLVMTMEDVIHLPDLEMAELVAEAQPPILGAAICKLSAETQARFLKNTKPNRLGAIKEAIEGEKGLGEIGRAQLKLITTARSLEKRGVIRTKRIPES